MLYGMIIDDWELVDADDNRLAVAGPEQISINSINQTLRRRKTKPATSASHSDGVGRSSSGQHRGGDAQLHGNSRPMPGGRQPQEPTSRASGPVVYKRYRLRLNNKSITGGDAREQAWQLLQELRKVIDPATRADHQLLSLDLTLVTAEGQQGAIESKAKALGAQVTIEDDDF